MTAAAAPAPRPVLPPIAARGAGPVPVASGIAAPAAPAPVAAPRAPVTAAPVPAAKAPAAPAPAAPPAANPAAPAPRAQASLRNDAVERHPVVRMIAELFDAAVVRVDPAGTLGQRPPEPAADGDPEAGDTDV